MSIMHGCVVAVHTSPGAHLPPVSAAPKAGDDRVRAPRPGGPAQFRADLAFVTCQTFLKPSWL